MEVLADTNVPEEYVFALRGDGHDVIYSRSVSELGQRATDAEITAYAESEGRAILTTDVSDFGSRSASVPILVAPQDMTGVQFGPPCHDSKHSVSIPQRRNRCGCPACDWMAGQFVAAHSPSPKSQSSNP